ncbi:hypothetical protein PHMEG_00036268 [Phytophthora megakarya]|uniref:Uncharacterized protein n=1 Tax=Phytophthora megakarya TaxID=4795 RepID=A0A225UMD3_9STRA|nr:hypothetical protein PHMEG_00036268 [Phytophthora megakarya]
MASRQVLGSYLGHTTPSSVKTRPHHFALDGYKQVLSMPRNNPYFSKSE